MLRCGQRDILTNTQAVSRSFIERGDYDSAEDCAQHCLDTPRCQFCTLNKALTLQAAASTPALVRVSVPCVGMSATSCKTKGM